MTENMVLEEADFEKFKQYCRSKGFDVCYFCPEISGTQEEITRHAFDSPKVIELKKSLFGFKGIPYDVAEWALESWRENLPNLREEFYEKVKQVKSGG